MSDGTHFVTCPLCEATCGLEVTVTDGAVKRIRGDQDDVFSGGFICPKGSTLKQLYEDPDRLQTPMVRRDGKLVEATWDEAFAEIDGLLAPILEAGGREALAVYLGNPNAHTLVGSVYGGAFIRSLATRNIFSASTVDQMPKHVTAGLMWGNPSAFPLPDLDRSDYLLILGGNPYESNGSLVTAPDFPGRLEALRNRGGRLVVVDPRFSKTAQNADEHHPIVPGTDIYLLLAMINVCFAEGLVEVGRLAEHVAGVAEVGELVDPYTPEACAPLCGIDADTIRRLAREFAAAPSASAYGRMGAHTVEFGTLTSWATDVLNVITGNLDRPGGIMFAAPPWLRLGEKAPGGRGYQVGRWQSRVQGLPEFNGELPSVTLAEEIETPGDGQIRALFLLAGNPVRSYPNSERLDAAFESLDLLVSVDPYITESNQHADVILPPRAALERSQFDFAFYNNAVRQTVNYSSPVFATDAPDDCDVMGRLSLLVAGFGPDADPELMHAQVIGAFLNKELADETSPIFGRDADEILAELEDLPVAERMVDLRLRVGRFGEGFGVNPDGLTLAKLKANPHGLDWGPLIERMPTMIKTKSGKVELAPEPIVADLDRLAVAFAKGPKDDGLVLVGRRHLRSNNSWMHNVKVLVKGKERCTLQVHPDDATRLGVADGGTATVSSRVGQVEAPVEVTDSVMPGVVSLPHGWGHDAPGARLSVAAEHAGVNSNALTDDSVHDALSGNAILNGIPVEVAPA